MYRAIVRERRYRRPVIRAKIFVQDLIAGSPDVDHARSAAEVELTRTVVPAPPPPPRQHPLLQDLHLWPPDRRDDADEAGAPAGPVSESDR
jgi:hypothetical protein